MLPLEDVQRYGGKAAILNYIQAQLPDMPVPSHVVHEFGHDIKETLPDFDSLRKPVIVRSSSPHEYGDFEGIFDSVPDVYDEYGLMHAIRQVEASARSDRAKQYVQQNGLALDDKIHAIVQEQSPSQYNGAMMRHPNNPNLIFITWFSGRGKYQREYSTFLFDEETQSESSLRGFYSIRMEEPDAKFLVEQYKRIESLVDIADGYSLFVEFGYEPFALYQARPFKKIETADFELPKISSNESIWADFVFGVTPKEGIALPVLRSVGFSEAQFGIENLGMEGIDYLLVHQLRTAQYAHLIGRDKEGLVNEYLKGWHTQMEGVLEWKPYCLMITSAHREEYDVDLSVPNMNGLVIGHPETFLVHGLMRLIKKADVTFGVPVIWTEELWKKIESLQNVRMISNGREGTVFRE